jgi:hypothetical protein
MHSEALQHLGRSPEANGPALLLNRQGGEKDGDEPILPERNAEFGMSGHLKNELAVPPFVKELLPGQAPDRQTTQDKRARAEAEFLILLFATDADQLDAAHLLELLARDKQLWLLVAKQVADGLENGPAMLAGR